MSYLLYGLFSLLFFPLLYLALLFGGMWGWAYVLGFIAIYLVGDNVLPKSDGKVSGRIGSLFDTLLVAHIPLSFIALLLLFWQIEPRNEMLLGCVQFFSNSLNLPLQASQQNSLFELIGLVMACGFMFGHNTAVAHEIMHRQTRGLFEASRLLFSMCGDAQVVISHIHSHHANVATELDPTSARRGDSIYKHFIRALFGQYRDSWKFEVARLKRHSIFGKLIKNQVINGLLMTIFWLALTALFVSPLAMLAWLVIMFIAKWLLESINYVQHYGLIRIPGSKIEPRHSWETRSLGSRIGLYNATCHGGHHVNGTIPFWQLYNDNKTLCLKHGYMFAIALSLFPPLWFRYIAPMLKQWDQSLASKEELDALCIQGHLKRTPVENEQNLNFGN